MVENLKLNSQAKTWQPYAKWAHLKNQAHFLPWRSSCAWLSSTTSPLPLSRHNLNKAHRVQVLQKTR